MSPTALSESGTLVRARGREWVVLPDSTDELLMLRPVGGLDEEITGILPAVEPVESATFRLPSREDLGDFTSGRLLRDAARLSTRAAAGPFRSFGRIAVEPRPYQLVPLMMALQLDPVRMLIADDVGIGKTIEAGLIARELLDRGEIRRLTVLCPPALAEQWQRELAEKFHIEAELVLSSTIQRLERDLHIDESVFERHTFTVVSTDFIKQPQRAEDFAHRCPEFVIVDEAHGCTLAGGAGKGRQQRHALLRRVTADRERHVLLVTATPHSGNEDAFRSLLSLLDEEFADLPADLDRAGREGARRRLARHLVQRRRGDIRRYLETDTVFPERRDKEATYGFSPTYRELFNDIVAFAREYVTVEGEQRRRRVRYWSALALLRCVSSSPAAAAATLRSRTAADEAEEDEVDDVGRRTVLDQSDDDDPLALDFSPGSDIEDSPQAMRPRLLEFARRAEGIDHAADGKLQGAVREIKALLKDGFHPVVFCRFIDTAEYVAHHLREVLRATAVEAVTGRLPPAEREARIQSLVEEARRFVLVCTDCLSEGINLQEHFDAVLHYDLAWNPTRHEQREGRVDRFGQRAPEVRVVTYFGTDNPIDGVILDVLIRKHKNIKSDLGVTVAVPGSSERIAEALFEGALFAIRKARSNSCSISLTSTTRKSRSFTTSGRTPAIASGRAAPVLPTIRLIRKPLPTNWPTCVRRSAAARTWPGSLAMCCVPRTSPSNSTGRQRCKSAMRRRVRFAKRSGRMSPFPGASTCLCRRTRSTSDVRVRWSKAWRAGPSIRPLIRSLATSALWPRAAGRSSPPPWPRVRRCWSRVSATT